MIDRAWYCVISNTNIEVKVLGTDSRCCMIHGIVHLLAFYCIRLTHLGHLLILRHSWIDLSLLNYKRFPIYCFCLCGFGRSTDIVFLVCFDSCDILASNMIQDVLAIDRNQWHLLTTKASQLCQLLGSARWQRTNTLLVQHIERI